MPQPYAVALLFCKGGIQLEGSTLLIIVCGSMLAILGLITAVSHMYNLNGIKSKTVGDGQHGAARFATAQELKRTYKLVPYEPAVWRAMGKDCEKLELPQGIVVGCKFRYGLHCDFKSGNGRSPSKRKPMPWLKLGMSTECLLVLQAVVRQLSGFIQTLNMPAPLECRSLQQIQNLICIGTT